MKSAPTFEDIIKITKYLTDMRDCRRHEQGHEALPWRVAAGLDHGLRQSVELAGRPDRAGLRGRRPKRWSIVALS